MLKKFKNIDGTSKKIAIYIAAVLVVFSCFALITHVLADTLHGSGDECMQFHIDDFGGFLVSSVTVNGEVWDTLDNHIYHTDNNRYEIVILAGKNGNDYPWISTAGGLDQYKTYTAVDNPEQDDNVDNDEYKLTLIMDGAPYDRGQEGTACYFFGITLAAGPFPVMPEIPTEANVSITISGDELEYHYVADKPDVADVTYFKFGINSGISDDIVPFTFGNADYTHNDNEPPRNVSSVTTKGPIHYEYVYDGTGFVTFYVNAGATDEYTKIEINGVDYSNQAPHNQIEYFEHLIGRALIFEIHNVPYADTYNVVVEGRQTALENRVGGVSWSYLSRERSNLEEDEAEGNFAHGKLEFVHAKYTDIDGVDHEFDSVQEYNNAKFHGTGEIYAWGDGRKDYPEEARWMAWGESQIPYGTELTLRIVPDAGYQLVGLAKSPTGFTATDEVGVYKIVLTAENFLYGNEQFDLQPVFVEIGAEVQANSVNVVSGNIETNQAVENGSLKLEVNDVISMSPERMESFETKAEDEGYEINNYLDISLYNSIYKGGKKDNNDNYLSWDTEVNDLDEAARITLELGENMEGKELVLIHEKHNGDELEYEVIPVDYHSEDNTISFETDSFSNYAVAMRNVEQESNENPENPPETVNVEFNSTGGSEVPSVTIDKGAKVDMPEDVRNGNLTLEGWYTDEELHNKFDFNTPVEEDITLYAKWVESLETYEIPDENGNMIVFEREEGHEYNLNITDFLSYSKEEVMALGGIDSDTYDQIFGGLKDGVKKSGELIAFYEIELEEEDHGMHEGPFTIKILMTDEMKKYNSFKMYYVNDDFMVEGDPITLTKEGNYLVGTLEHLSLYVLAGDNTSIPKTGDNIVAYVSLGIISVLGLAISALLLKKKQLFN